MLQSSCPGLGVEAPPRLSDGSCADTGQHSHHWDTETKHEVKQVTRYWCTRRRVRSTAGHCPLPAAPAPRQGAFDQYREATLSLRILASQPSTPFCLLVGISLGVPRRSRGYNSLIQYIHPLSIFESRPYRSESRVVCEPGGAGWPAKLKTSRRART
jgi:hypothetical protein